MIPEDHGCAARRAADQEGRLRVEAEEVTTGFFGLVKDVVGKERLDGVKVLAAYPIWTDDTALMNRMVTMVEKYRPSDATLKAGSNWGTGWLVGEILAEVVRNAAESVGAENVDKAAIADALKSLNFEMDGMEPITLTGKMGERGIYYPYRRVIEYRAAQDKWYAVSDWMPYPE